MMAPLGTLSLPEALFDKQHAAMEQSSIYSIPLIVWKNGDGYHIIDGCKRYHDFLARGAKECACGVIESGFDETGAGLLRLALNSGRTLHYREKFLFVRWLKTRMSAEEYRTNVQKLHLSAIERHELELLIECSNKLVDAVMQGTLDSAVAPEMGHLKEADVDSILGLFQTIPFSRQMQRELVEWLHEIAFSQRTTIRGLLASNEFSEILSAPRLNLPQKAAKLHEIAHAHRFPLYTKAKERWKEHARKTNPDPASLSFQASPFFEKRGVEVRIKIDDADEAVQLMNKLALIKTGEWRKLIDPTEMG